MTKEEIKVFVTEAVKDAMESRKRIKGMTEDQAKAEVNAFLSGMVNVLLKTGEVTKGEGLDLFTDLYII